MMTKPPSFVDLPRFLRAVEKTNPFKRDTVTGTKGADVDVQDVHRREFLRLRQAVENVRSEGGAMGVLLLAPAGLGKSHLLARLDRWAREDGRSTMVILHNLIATPERMARAVLGATIHLLAGAREVAFAQSDLYALLNYAIGRLYHGRGAPSVQKRCELLRQAGARLDPQGSVIAALAAFLENTIGADHAKPGASERAQLAIEWLSGQEIDTEQARELGLSSSTGETAMLPEGAEERVFIVLAGLSALAERPLVLCIDQVDNLDAEAIGALSRFLHAVIDHTSNLVVVTSGVKAAMLHLHEQKIIPDSAWDRMAQMRLELAMIRPEEAKKIVGARIDHFMEPFRLIESLVPYRQRDPLFPLPSGWLDKHLSDAEYRPRDIISWCRERWAEEQIRASEVGDAEWLRTWGNTTKGTGGGDTGPGTDPKHDDVASAIDAAVSLKIQECVEQRRLRPQGLPPDSSRFSELLLRLLGYCRDRGYTMVDYESHPQKPLGPYHLSVKERAGSHDLLNGVTFVATTSKASATNALKRMTVDRKPPQHRILVTEERRPLTVGPKGKEYLDALKATGSQAFRHMELRFDDYALLDALAETAGAARVGDLEVEWPTGTFRPISEAEAVEAMHRKQWFLRQPLLAELLTEEPPITVTQKSDPPLDPGRASEFIVAELSWRICMTARELAEIWRERENRPKAHLDAIWQQLKQVAAGLAKAGKVDVTASEDDLFLQSMGQQ